MGFEFATTSVTSPGLEDYLGIPTADEARNLESGVTQLVSDLDYCNIRERGLMLVTFTREQAVAEWQFIDTTKQRNYQTLAELNKTLTLQSGGDSLV